MKQFLVFAFLFTLANVAGAQLTYTPQEYEKYITKNVTANPAAVGGEAHYINAMREQDRIYAAQKRYDRQTFFYNQGFLSKEKFETATRQYKQAMQPSADFAFENRLIDAHEAAARQAAVPQKKNYEADVLAYFAQPSQAPHKAEFDGYIQRGNYRAAMAKAAQINQAPAFAQDRAYTYYYILRAAALKEGVGPLSPARDMAVKIATIAPAPTSSLAEGILAGKPLPFAPLAQK